MITFPFVPAVIFCVGLSAVGICLRILYVMIGKINRKLSTDQQVTYAFIPVKALTLVREYKRTYPHGRLGIASIVFLALGLSLIAIGAVQLVHFWQVNPWYKPGVPPLW
ncbi:MAG: hypothetical protein WBF06_13995 [Candidatus Acidiferrales bacterium]